MPVKTNCKHCAGYRDCWIAQTIRNDGVPPFHTSEQDLEIYCLALDHRCPVFDPADEEE